MLLGMQLRAQMEVAAPAGRVWWLVGEKFGEIAEWAPGLAASRLEGELDVATVRVCQAHASWPFKAGTVRERLLSFDRATMTLAYRAIEGLPSFMEHEFSRWSVTPLSAARCRVDVCGELHVHGAMRLLTVPLGWMLQRMARQALVELAQYITRTGLSIGAVANVCEDAGSCAGDPTRARAE